MLWKRRDASERIFIRFEYELKKKHALEEEGCPREDFDSFLQVLNKKYALKSEGFFRRGF